MKKIYFLFLSLVCILTMFIGVTFASAATYPGTNITVKPGDIIHSPKNKSTYFAGHTAIVGSDNYIYHAIPNTNGKAKDTITYYFDERFSKGDKFTILRPKNSSHAEPAAEMAPTIYSNITTYAYNSDAIKLDNFSHNYCSKFVWQAYYYGNSFNVDILGKGYKYYTQAYILPSEILSASGLSSAGSFTKQ